MRLGRALLCLVPRPGDCAGTARSGRTNRCPRGRGAAARDLRLEWVSDIVTVAAAATIGSALAVVLGAERPDHVPLIVLAARFARVRLVEADHSWPPDASPMSAR